MTIYEGEHETERELGSEGKREVLPDNRATLSEHERERARAAADPDNPSKPGAATGTGAVVGGAAGGLGGAMVHGAALGATGGAVAGPPGAATGALVGVVVGAVGGAAIGYGMDSAKHGADKEAQAPGRPTTPEGNTTVGEPAIGERQITTDDLRDPERP